MTFIFDFMTNIVRKALREIMGHLQELRDSCENYFEVSAFNQALIYLSNADYHDFHINPKRKYVVPKSNFKFKN